MMDFVFRFCEECKKETKQRITSIGEYKCTVCCFYQGFKKLNVSKEGE